MSFMVNDTNGQPAAFVLDDQSVILKDTLDKFALKSDEVTNFREDVFTTKAATDNAQSKQLKEDVYTTFSLVTPPYPPNMLTSLKDMNSYHYAAVKTKGTDIGGLGFDIVPNGDNDNRNQNDKQLLIEFFNRCYPTPEDLFSRAASDEEDVGWLGIELIRLGGLQTSEPLRLEHIPSHTFRIHKDGNRFMQTWDGINNVWFKLVNYKSKADSQDKDVHIKTGEEHPLGSLPPEEAANEIIYDINYSSGTSYYGTPDSVPAIRTMLGDQSAVNYNLSFFKNFATPRYAVYIIGAFKDQPILDDNGDPTGKTVLQQAIEEKFASVRQNPHGNLVFMLPLKAGGDAEVKIEFQELSTQVTDSSFRLYRIDARNEVLTANGMDPFRAMVVENYGSGGGNTVSTITRKNYKEVKIKPKQRRLEALINKHIIWADKPKGFGITDWAFKLKELDTEDRKLESDINTARFERGEISPNELRKIGGLEEIDHPSMNAHYVHGQPITLDTIVDTTMPLKVAKLLDIAADKVENNE
jgi:PBSX family phage portal protein